MIAHREWDDALTPRVQSVQCKQFSDGVRMTLEVNLGPDLGLLLDASNLELMRRMLEAYRGNLMDLDAA